MRGHSIVVTVIIEFIILYGFKLIAFVLFVASTGVLFSDTFRRNWLALGMAAAISIASSVLLVQQLCEWFPMRVCWVLGYDPPNLSPPAGAAGVPPSQPEATQPPLTAAGESGVAPNTQPEGFQPGRVFRDCDGCPEMVVVPAGSFTMGSPATEEGRSEDEGPQREVTIGNAFAVGKHEVTFAEWEACVAGGGCTSNRSPSDQGWGKGTRPVINVSWHDAHEYVLWLSVKTGKTYRLLSEAEWEYAARAGTTTAYPWGTAASHDFANYGKDECCGGLAQGLDQWVNSAPVGSFPANRFGLHDMHGNVWEWVEDCWNEGYSGAPADGLARTAAECGRRVVRGGSWFNLPRAMRSADRSNFGTGERTDYFGFRLARTL